jgi:hypothetical protein
VNLAFDILTPTSIKKGDKSSKKEKTNYNVFLDQEAISFDSSSKHNEVESGLNILRNRNTLPKKLHKLYISVLIIYFILICLHLDVKTHR